MFDLESLQPAPDTGSETERQTQAIHSAVAFKAKLEKGGRVMR
jgi:hypothetical protein